MKTFFKQYSYNVVRDVLNQFAISIFGALLSMATSAAESNTLSIVVSAFAIAFYLYLVYTTTWEIGAKDRVSVDVGKKPYRPHTGLLISAVANIPKLLIAILFIVAAYLIPNESIASTMEVIVRLAYMVLGGMYTGLMMSVKISADGATMISAWWSYFVFIIPALVVSWVAYYTGFKNFRLVAPLFDKKNKKK
ncbi:MAG: hypothetical protein IJ011_01075 [Clostridia bacterium]|nr:hypothetical protein [Clostridia bacterium]